MLKRCIGKLVEELKGQDPQHTQARVKYMREILLPRCYVWVAIILVLFGRLRQRLTCSRPFSQLIRDNQFSALGLTLVAELAKTQRAIGTGGGEGKEGVETELEPMVSTYESIPEVSEDLGEAVGRSTAIASKSEDPNIPTTESSDSQRVKDAERRVQGRETDAMGPLEHINPPATPLRKEGGSAPIVSRLKAPPRTTKKQKRKPANPIDDLFQGLD